MATDFMDQLPGGILRLNDAGFITLINATAEQQLGYPPGELVGQPFEQLLTVAGRMFYQTHLFPSIRFQGRTDESSVTLLTRTGERIPVLFNAIRQQQEDGWNVFCVYLPVIRRHHFETELIQARKAAEQAQAVVLEREAQYQALAAQLEVLVQQRTHELIQANAQLIQLNGDLKRSNENLQQFAYVASHDLQEPLRKIQQFSDLLKTCSTSDVSEEIHYLERIQSSAQRMSTLIRDLLDYSRVNVQQELNTLVSLEDVVNQVLTTMEMVIKETGATVHVSGLPIIFGNDSQLNQLFQNLLSNALKFQLKSVAPFIRISSEIISMDELPLLVKPSRTFDYYHRIDVTDNGIGFDEKYLDRIFQAFQRLYGKNEFAGTGIGLSICEKVASNHGGAIMATSQPGKGATFSVYLPVVDDFKKENELVFNPSSRVASSDQRSRQIANPLFPSGNCRALHQQNEGQL